MPTSHIARTQSRSRRLFKTLASWKSVLKESVNQEYFSRRLHSFQDANQSFKTPFKTLNCVFKTPFQDTFSRHLSKIFTRHRQQSKLCFQDDCVIFKTLTLASWKSKKRLEKVSWKFRRCLERPKFDVLKRRLEKKSKRLENIKIWRLEKTSWKKK